MENSIKICMPKADADEVQRIFDRKDKPGFIIVNRIDIPETDIIQLELIGESTMDIWFLAQEVQLIQDHTKRMDEVTQKINDLK